MVITSSEIRQWPWPPKHAIGIPYPEGTTWWAVTLHRTEPAEGRDRKRQLTITLPMTSGAKPTPYQALDMMIQAARNYIRASGVREWQEMEGLPSGLSVVPFYNEVGKYTRRLRKFLGADYEKIVLRAITEGAQHP